MSNNEWIVRNHGVVFRLLDQLERYRLKGSYGGALDLDLIQRVISESYKEISNLQSKLTLAHEEYQSLKKTHEEMVSKLQTQAPEPGKGKKGKGK